MLSDIFVFSGFGLISPILAIFIKDDLIGGTILSAGIASAIFLIVHSILQIIFAKKFNPKDRLWMVLLGTAPLGAWLSGYLFDHAGGRSAAALMGLLTLVGLLPSLKVGLPNEVFLEEAA